MWSQALPPPSSVVPSQNTPSPPQLQSVIKKGESVHATCHHLLLGPGAGRVPTTVQCYPGILLVWLMLGLKLLPSPVDLLRF